MKKTQIYRINELPWLELSPEHFDKRMVTDEKTGMIVNVSRYKKGHVLPKHTHTCAHGMYVIEGYMSTDKGIVGPGEFVWFPAGVEMEHGVVAEEDCTFLFITNGPFDISYVE